MKVESSMLKECRKEKTRGAFHPKCRNERRKVNSLPSLHFFSFLLVFFSLCVYVFLFSVWEEEDVRRKHLKRKCKSRRTEVKTKNEKAERKLEGKLRPFSAFFFFSITFFLCVCVCVRFFFAWEEENARKTCLKQSAKARRQKQKLKMRR